LFKELEPKGFVNMLKRRMPWLALKNNSSPASVEARKKLEHFTIDFLKRLAVNKFI
jgi:hypothetical protein